MPNPLSHTTYVDILSAPSGSIPSSDMELQKLAALAYFRTTADPAHLQLLVRCLADESLTVSDKAAEVGRYLVQ